MPGALSTDLYEISMAAGYHAGGQLGRATFELWVRALPPERGYLVVAGLEQVVEHLENLQFRPGDISYLRGLPALRNVRADFFDQYLPAFEFRGDLWAMPEGTPAFAGEPLLRVTASLPEAQVVETTLLATVLFQTMVASKASRIVNASQGRPVVEFGGRRAHGIAAAELGARAAFIGGCSGTSNLSAGRRFDIPVSGTMAHSWVMSHRTEDEAFRRYLEVHGDDSVLLIDTYDTRAAARRIVRGGLHPKAVRLDSGDLARLSVDVRRILDAGGLDGTRILASGDLDEHAIEALLETSSPVDGFGVGTALSTSGDAPSLSGVYKLVEVERGGTTVQPAKWSVNKETHPGVKQVWRCIGADGNARDVVGLSEETPPEDGTPLLQPVMRDGHRLSRPTPLADIQRACLREVARLPRGLTRLRDAAPYPVVLSPTLAALGPGAAVE